MTHCRHKPQARSCCSLFAARAHRHSHTPTTTTSSSSPNPIPARCRPPPSPGPGRISEHWPINPRTQPTPDEALAVVSSNTTPHPPHQKRSAVVGAEDDQDDSTKGEQSLFHPQPIQPPGQMRQVHPSHPDKLTRPPTSQCSTASTTQAPP